MRSGPRPHVAADPFRDRAGGGAGREDLPHAEPLQLRDVGVGDDPAAEDDHVVGALSDIFKQNTCDHWIALLEANDIPTCRVNRLEDVLASEQIAENKLVVTRDDPKRGHISVLKFGLKLKARALRPY